MRQNLLGVEIDRNLTFDEKFQHYAKRLNYYRVWLNGLWFVIHNAVLNLHDWILCYQEPFHGKIKWWNSLEFWMSLWTFKYCESYLNTSNTELCWTLCSFSLYLFFLYCSQSGQLILKKSYSRIYEKHD